MSFAEKKAQDYTGKRYAKGSLKSRLETHLGKGSFSSIRTECYLKMLYLTYRVHLYRYWFFLLGC